jgi:prepilin-type processing-associated H-X9-DG protein
MRIIAEGTGMSNWIERMRSWELGCAVVLIGILAAILLPALAREPACVLRRDSCQNNLKQMGLVFAMYAGESVGGLFPPMMVADVPLVDCDATPPTETEKRGMMLAAPLVPSIYPEYISDPNVFLCPTDSSSSRDEFTSPEGDSYFHEYCSQPRRGARAAGNSYAYTGYAYLGGDIEAREAAQLRAVLGPVMEAAGRGEWAKAESLVQEDVTVPQAIAPPGAAEPKVYRLREAMGRFLVTDVNDYSAIAKVESEIWTMHDRVHLNFIEFNHIPAASNVLFLDGHVELVEFMNKPTDTPPVSAAIAEAYALVDGVAGE